MRKQVGVWSVRVGLLGAVWLAATGHGCAAQEDEGEYVLPPQFNEQQTQQVTLSGHNFLRDDARQLRTATSYGRLARARAMGISPQATQDIPTLRHKLEAVFHDTYADGLTVSVATHPQASLKVVPVSARRAAPRLRKDGAVIAYEEAFPNVTSAYGGRDSKLEEFLLIPSEKDIPTLAYDLHPGPEFGHFEEEDGRLWAYARDGAGLFTIEPPVADDAAGKRVVGAWQLTEQGRGYRLTARIDLQGLAFPVLLDPTFETPLWFRHSSGQPSPRSGAASAFDPETNCSFVFGGAISSSFALSQDLAVRCADRRWKAGLAPSTLPPKRAYAAMAHFGGSTRRMFLFGGYGEAGALNDLWRADLTCSTPGVSSTCNVAWTQITVPPTGPVKRYLHGMAWDGSKLLVFGGIGNTGAGLRDTWSYDADTNTWTQECTTCFGGAKGNYGFATATQVNGSRTVYVSGGYDDPTSGSGNFLNSVLRWNGSSWVDVSAQDATIPTNAFGAIQGGSPTSMQPRYLHWMAPSSSKRLMMGSGVTSGGTDVYHEDVWHWNDRQTEGEPNQWTRGVVPLASSIPNAPGRRESASAIYDENHKEIVLFGGLTSPTSVSSNTRIYRGVEHDFTYTQTCTTPGCAYVKLDVTFPGLTESTSPKCSDMQASFSYRSISGVWQLISKFTNATFDGSTCSQNITYARVVSTIVDFVARTRDRRFHEDAIACTTTGSEQEITGANKPACLTNGGEGYASCGGLASPSTPSLVCDKY